jgi:protein CpxP
MKQIAIRTLVALALVTGMVFAQGPGLGLGKAGLRGAGRRVANQLDLTDAQKQQARSIMEQTRRDAAPLRQELKQNRKALNEAVQAGKSEAEIRQLAAAQGNTLGQLLALRSQARARMVSQLTPEQKAKAAQLREQVREKMQRRLEKRKAG